MPATNSRASERPATIREFLTYILPDFVDAMPAPLWPPDVFAIAASLLQKSGAYNHVVRNWPPKALPVWVQEMRATGLEWRANWVFTRSVPQAVQSWWNMILQSLSLPIASIRDNAPLCEALIQLCAAADEASSGFGVPPGDRLRDLRERSGESLDVTKKIAGVANRTLDLDKTTSGSTLCKQIHASRLRVLPKLHVPQNGLTIRSFSRNLALCTGEEIRPEWIYLPSARSEPSRDRSLNLLLLPWPLVVRPSQFKPVAPAPEELAVQRMPDNFRFFTYDPAPGQMPMDTVLYAMRYTRNLVGSLGGVVLPELAVSSSQHTDLRDTVLGQNAFLIAGIAKSPAAPGLPGQNAVDFSVRSTLGPVDYEQTKHHRWKLDKSQIIQYGLGSILDPDKMWWEHIGISSRKLNFVAISEWLTLSVLICEDLARPDPVGDMVRAVGPNLLVALLMDGPQLTSRWSSRYATVLADDPGCSVLSITSHGTAKLCRPPHITPKPNIVALWKDARSGSPIEIEIGPTDIGVVLCLTVQYLEEFTADGRSDRCTTGYPILAGIHPIPALPHGYGGILDLMKPMPASDASTLANLAEFPDVEEDDRERLLKPLSAEAREIAEVLLGINDGSGLSAEAKQKVEALKKWAISTSTLR